MKTTIIIIAIGCLIAVGCKTIPEGISYMDWGFDIPPSLVWRMYQAHNAVRDRQLRQDDANGGQNFDGEEMFGLFVNGFTNAEEIVARPRGEMMFCGDMMTDEERKSLWPFNVEVFEAELESKMVCDEEYLFRKKHEPDDNLPTDANGLVAPNPTIRWVNDEIERWAIPRLDAKFTRMDDEMFRKAAGGNAIPEGWLVWMVADLGDVRECFAIAHGDGAWNPRYYMDLLCDDEGITIVASFDSFPNRREAAAMRKFGRDIRAVHNLAVLEWRHRNFRIGIDPKRIKRYLEEAKRHNVSTAETNLKVLHDHIPEADEEWHTIVVL